MPPILWINEIFPEPQQPFTVAEMTRRLQELFNPVINDEMIFRAIRVLRKRPAVASLVTPLDGRRPAHYSADAAQRIARHVTHDIELTRPQMPLPEKIKSSLHLPVTFDAPSANMDVAA